MSHLTDTHRLQGSGIAPWAAIGKRGGRLWNPWVLHRSTEAGRRCSWTLCPADLVPGCQSWCRLPPWPRAGVVSWPPWTSALMGWMQHVHWTGNSTLELQKRCVRLTHPQWGPRSLRLSPRLMIWSIFEWWGDLSFVTLGSERAFKVTAWFTSSKRLYRHEIFPVHHVNPSAPQT